MPVRPLTEETKPCILCADDAKPDEYICKKCLIQILKEQRMNLMQTNNTKPIDYEFRNNR